MSLESRQPFRPYYWCQKDQSQNSKEKVLSPYAKWEEQIGIFRNIKLVGNNIVVVVIIEDFGHCAYQTKGRIKILRQNRDILKQFRIFSNIIFKVFWPLCRPVKQENNLLIIHLKYHQWDLISLKWPSKNQYHEHLIGSYH